MNDRIYYSQEAARRAYRERMIVALIVAGFGIAIGAVIALLLAPSSGDETRRQLGQSIDSANQHGREVAEQVIKDVNDRLKKVGS